jgi:hypothetical protein
MIFRRAFQIFWLRFLVIKKGTSYVKRHNLAVVMDYFLWPINGFIILII